MLFENNGESLILYNNSNDKENNDSKSKKFKIGNFNIKLSKKFISDLLPILIGLYIGSFISTSISKNIIVEFKPSIESIKTSNNITNVEITSELEPVDYQDAIDLINSSYLSPVQKEIATNESLLKDLFLYYKDTNMEYVIRERLSNLKVELFSKDYIEDVLGFYNELEPNIIHIRDDVQGEKVFKHELIHLLQQKHEYKYLVEATAELVSYEYLDSEIENYIQSTSNTKLLMDVIGPKMIWETVFGESDTNFLSIIKDNLNESEADELISYLKQRPNDIDDIIEKVRIPKLISNLYRNINLSDIKDDRNIYDAYGNHITRIYFNEDKMYLKTIKHYGIEEAINLNLITPIYEEFYLKEIPKEEYIKLNDQLQNNPEYQKILNELDGMIPVEEYKKRISRIKSVDVKYFSNNENVEIIKGLNGSTILYKNKVKNGEFEKEVKTLVSTQDALEMGLISAKYYEVINGENLTENEKQKYELDYIIVSKYQENNNDVKILILYDENGNPNTVQVTYGVKSIKEIFPDQTVRSQNNYNVIR